MKYTFLILIFVSSSTAVIAQNNFNDSLIKILDTVSQSDQLYRDQLESAETKYGGQSKEVAEIIKRMSEQDSINLVKVELIINKFGWLGANVLGIDGNETLFFVIQHADSATREKYLPIMREAVKRKNAKANELALLEDRFALEHHKKQLYGSQLYWDMKENKVYVFPMIDPANIDKIRAAVGLTSMNAYLSNWQLKWSLEQ